MISEILLDGIVGVESKGYDAESYLFAEEEAALGFSVDRRRLEFATGRTIARRALAQLGMPTLPILRGSHREALWPPGIVGSITHCMNYCAVAVARRSQIATIGIDADLSARLPEGVLDLVATEEERKWLETRSRDSKCWDKIMFSAKESIYKAWFPVAHKWLGFEDVVVTIKPDSGEFHARFLVTGLVISGHPITGMYGRFLEKDGIILTAACVPCEIQR